MFLGVWAFAHLISFVDPSDRHRWKCSFGTLSILIIPWCAPTSVKKGNFKNHSWQLKNQGIRMRQWQSVLTERAWSKLAMTIHGSIGQRGPAVAPNPGLLLHHLWLTDRQAEIQTDQYFINTHEKHAIYIYIEKYNCARICIFIYSFSIKMLIKSIKGIQSTHPTKRNFGSMLLSTFKSITSSNATHAMALSTTVSESVSFPVLAAETAGATVSVTAGATVATWQNKSKSTSHHKIPNLLMKDVNLPLIDLLVSRYRSI